MHKRFTLHPTVWGVVAVAAAIAVLALVQGGIKEGQFLALFVFLAFGALFPPLAIGVGIVIIAAMLLRGGGTALADKVGNLANRGGSGRVTASPLGPQIPKVDIAAGYNPFPPANIVVNPTPVNVVYNPGTGVA